MDKLELFSKCLNLVEGRENPESWWGWWNEHESEVEKLLNHGRMDFLGYQYLVAKREPSLFWRRTE